MVDADPLSRNWHTEDTDAEVLRREAEEFARKNGGRIIYDDRPEDAPTAPLPPAARENDGGS